MLIIPHFDFFLIIFFEEFQLKFEVSQSIDFIIANLFFWQKILGLLKIYKIAAGIFTRTKRFLCFR